MATPGFSGPRKIYGAQPRAVMGGFMPGEATDMLSPGLSAPAPLFMDPNEGPTPGGPVTPASGGSGGFMGLLQDLLPSIINAGAAWYGNKNQAGEYQAAANQSTGKPTPVQSMFGNVAYNPNTGIQLTPGQAPGAFGGAPPELINAFNQLNDQGAISQEAGGRLGLLRQLAQPEEQRATQGLEQRLFSQGRLGGTGGAVQQEALARAQGSADLERQLASQDWARNNALQRFNAATGVIGAGQAQQGIDFGQALNLGKLAVDAGRPPNADLLAAMAGSKGAGLQAILGALGAGQDGGLGGLLGGIFGGGQQAPQKPSSLAQLGFLGQSLGQNFGGSFGDAAGGIGSILSGLDSKNYGQVAGGVGGLLGMLGNATGSGALGKIGSVLGSLGGVAGGSPTGILSGLSGLFGGSGALGSSAASTGSALGSLGAIGSGAGSALSSLGSALGPVGAVAGFLNMGELWHKLGMGVPKGQSAFTHASGWDPSYFSSWSPQDQQRYAFSQTPQGQAAEQAARDRRNSRTSYWNTPGATMPSNGII